MEREINAIGQRTQDVAAIRHTQYGMFPRGHVECTVVDRQCMYVECTLNPINEHLLPGSCTEDDAKDPA